MNLLSFNMIFIDIGLPKAFHPHLHWEEGWRGQGRGVKQHPVKAFVASSLHVCARYAGCMEEEAAGDRGGRKGGGHKWSREGRMFDDELQRGSSIDETVSDYAS